MLSLESPEDRLSDARAAATAGLDQAWADLQAYACLRTNYLAYLEGQPVSAGSLLLATNGLGILAGGCTTPAARGRGCSAPILRGLGFRQVATLTVLRQHTR